ncbi:MAG: chorismate mutase [Bacteroidia bacterium]
MNTLNQQQLDDLRTELDLVDRELVRLLAKRQHLVEELSALKTSLNLPIEIIEHWEVSLSKRLEEGKSLQIHPEWVNQLFNTLHKLSIELQQQLRNEAKPE